MNLNFIKLDINILNDNKIKIIRKYPEGEKLIVLWIGLLCLAMKSETPGYIYITQGIPYTTIELANELDIPEKTVEMGLNLFKKYNMIDLIEGDIIEVINFNKHQKLDKIERIRQISRESSKRFRDKQKLKLLSDCHVTKKNVSDTDTDTDTDKKKIKKKKLFIKHGTKVKLTDKQYHELIKKFGNKSILTDLIIKMNEYLDNPNSKRHTYKCYYRALLDWHKREWNNGKSKPRKETRQDDVNLNDWQERF
jgi:predicted phage replisome organizer